MNGNNFNSSIFTLDESYPEKEVNSVRTFLQTPQTYEFYQAVNFLNNVYDSGILVKFREESFIQKGETHFKTFGKVRFRSTVKYATPVAAIEKVEITASKDGAFFQPTIWLNFTGIAGIQGPLALIYTERVFRNIRNRDRAFSSFLDIFNHRIASITYEAPKSIPGFLPIKPEHSDLGRTILALCGIDSSSINFEKGIEEYDLRRYFLNFKSLFWRRIRSTENLKQMLSSFVSEKVEIQEHIGEFLDFSKSGITKIGLIGGSLYSLGKDTYLGKRIWKNNKKIRIKIFDVDFKKYQTFNYHKEGRNTRHLINIFRAYVPFNVIVECVISIREDCKKTSILGDNHNLGFDTWLGTKPRFSNIKNHPIRINIT